jgi:hypothetical protein
MTAATHNGTFPEDARSAAELYLQLGLAPIPVPHGTKGPRQAGWPEKRRSLDWQHSAIELGGNQRASQWPSAVQGVAGDAASGRQHRLVLSRRRRIYLAVVLVRCR